MSGDMIRMKEEKELYLQYVSKANKFQNFLEQ